MESIQGFTVPPEKKIDFDDSNCMAIHSKQLREIFKKSLRTLSEKEVKIVGHIKRLQFGFFHRLTPERLEQSLNQGSFLTLEESMKLTTNKHVSRTPPSERFLYNAQNYVLGWIGFWPATDKFGSIIVEIKPSYWRRHSWATLRSGYEYFMLEENTRRALVGMPQLTENELTYDRYDQPTEDQVRSARKFMVGEVVVPKDYKTISALAILHLFRERNIPIESYFKGKSVSTSRLMELLSFEYVQNRRKVGFFEGKLLGNVSVDQIQRVTFTKRSDLSTFSQEFLEKKHIPFIVSQ